MAVINELIQAGIALKEAGKADAAIEHFRQLDTTFPDHPRVKMEYAAAYDYAGLESEAIPLYREVLKIGLPDKEMPRLYVQLGNALRNEGNADEALDISQ